MKFIRFIDQTGEVHWGQPIDDQTARPLIGDVYGKFEISKKSVEIVTRLAPAEPPNVIAIGRNYPEHAREMNAEVDTEPLIFLKATSSVIGPDEPILLPNSAPNEVDFE